MHISFGFGALSAIVISSTAIAQYSYSGTDLGLITSGNQIVDQNGNNVRLTGVNWSGFETPIGIVSGLYLSPSATTSPDFRDYLEKMKSLGFNCIRLPWSYANMICNEPAAAAGGCAGATSTYIAGAFYNPPYSGDDQVNQLPSSPFFGKQLNAPLFDTTLPPVAYALQAKTPLQCMDEVIKYAGSIGLKIILDNHCIDSGGFTTQPLWYSTTTNTPCTQQQWIDEWVVLATRYASDTYDPYHAVIACDLFNEPKMQPWNQSGSAWTTATGSQSWNHAAETCGKAILAANSRLLIMVEGVQWANDSAVMPTTSVSGTYTNWGGNLKGAAAAPIVLGSGYTNKLVYSTHDYPGTAQTLGGQNVLPWFSSSSYPQNLAADAWRPFWGFLVENNVAPIHVGEFGSWLQNPNILWVQSGATCGNATALTDTQITSDRKWVNALLHYMQGDWTLSQTIGTAAETQPISVTVGGDATKVGISFTWFGFTPNSADTGGILACDYNSTDTPQFNYIKAYLAPLLPEYDTALGSDLNGDGHVRAEDLLIFLALWGAPTGGLRFERGDFNHDGVRNGADLGVLLGRWLP